MIRKIALIFASLFVVCANAAQKPNVIFIFADDLGYGDLGCYGHPYAKTPALDRLAKEGTRFTQAYVTGVTCCPSRTGLMTGKHPATFQKYMADFGFGDRVTITELLQKNGYRTGHFGKWHIGPTEKPGTYGIKVIQGKPDRNAGVDRATLGRDAYLIDGAIKFLKANAKEKQPFYMNVWGHISHFPVQPAKHFADRFKDVKVDEAKFGPELRKKFAECRALGGNVDEGMRNYLGDVFSMDQGIGRLLKVVDELGLRENTIVIFSSDHGPAPVKLADDRNKQPSRIAAARNMLGSAGPFRGGKHNQYEGGVRVPFIIRWPGHVPANRVNNTSVISFIDWLPTICKLTGTKNSMDDLDGENMADVWLGAKRTRTRPLFWRVSSANGQVSIRDDNWKYHHFRKQRGGPQLYDLSNDPAESHNLAEAHPEVVRQLHIKIDEWVEILPASYIKKEKRKPRPKK